MPAQPAPLESDCVNRIRSGDQAAFRTLYEQYHAPLYRFSLRMLKSPFLAEEAVHDVFLKVWQRRETLDGSRSVRSYLFTICKNHILNVLASVSRNESLHRHLFHFARLSGAQAEDDLVYAEYERVTEQAVSRLPPQRQTVFRLCCLEGKSYEEAAGLLHISKGTVSDHMVKAIRFVREYLHLHAGIRLSLLYLGLLCTRDF